MKNQGRPRRIASETALVLASVGTGYPGLDLWRPFGGGEGGELMGGEAMSQVGILSHEVAQLRFFLGSGDDKAAGFVLFGAGHQQRSLVITGLQECSMGRNRIAKGVEGVGEPQLDHECLHDGNSRGG